MICPSGPRRCEAACQRVRPASPERAALRTALSSSGQLNGCSAIEPGWSAASGQVLLNVWMSPVRPGLSGSPRLVMRKPQRGHVTRCFSLISGGPSVEVIGEREHSWNAPEGLCANHVTRTSYEAMGTPAVERGAQGVNAWTDREASGTHPPAIEAHRLLVHVRSRTDQSPHR